MTEIFKSVFFQWDNNNKSIQNITTYWQAYRYFCYCIVLPLSLFFASPPWTNRDYLKFIITNVVFSGFLVGNRAFLLCFIPRTFTVMRMDRKQPHENQIKTKVCKTQDSISFAGTKRKKISDKTEQKSEKKDHSSFWKHWSQIQFIAPRINLSAEFTKYKVIKLFRHKG